ncbi:MAG: aminopeptidase N [Bdellovibrionales bacterium]|nr:aminopeptidase N [Bdellovibrionales bacterium]
MIAKHLFIFLCFIFILACSSLNKEGHKNTPDLLTVEEAVERKAAVADVEYDLDIQLNKEKDYSGVTKIKFKALKNDTPLRVDFSGGEVQKVTVNNKDVPVDYNGVYFHIPANQLLKDQMNEVIVTYSHNYSTDSRGLNYTLDKENGNAYVHTQFEPYDANRVFPCFDQPDLKAYYTLKMTAPSSWQVISAELENKIEKLNDTQKRWYFPKTKKFSTYIFSFHAGDYFVWHDKYKNIPLRLFARKTLAKHVKPKVWFDATKQGLKFYPEYFKTPFPYNKYDQIITPEFSFGAMENVGAVTFNEAFVSRGNKTKEEIRGLKSTIFHEMAHMWFGNLVTMKWWNDLWLNESFATYISTLALYKTEKSPEEYWVDFNNEKEWAYWEDRLVTTHPILTPVENTDQAFTNFDGITYGKGASVLKQLVYYIGEQSFRKGLSLYFKRHAEQNTELKDFFAALGEAANKDLALWQQQWLQTTGVNLISTQVKCENNKISQFSLHQEAVKDHPTLRTHKLLVALMDGRGQQVKPYKTQAVTITGGEVKVPEFVGLKCPTVVYPNYQDHAYVNVQLDDQTVAYLEQKIENVKHPLVVKMLWMDLWRMVRDGKFDVKRYGQMILSKADKVNNPDVFGAAMRFKNVVAYYPQKTMAEKKEFLTYTQKAESVLWKILMNPRKAVDLKKEAFRQYLSTLRSATAIENAAKLLKNTPESKAVGFKIDQDLRWEIIVSLAANNYAKTQELVNVEKTRDPSNKGVKAAQVALASLPNWQQKESWIENFKNPKSSYSLDTLKSVARNILPLQQQELRKKYSSQFFKDLDTVIHKRDMVYAASFVNLSPQFCEMEDPDLITPYLEKNTQLSPLVSKQLKITRQESQRCLNIRKFSRKMLEPQNSTGHNL